MTPHPGRDDRQLRLAGLTGLGVLAYVLIGLAFAAAFFVSAAIAIRSAHR